MLKKVRQRIARIPRIKKLLIKPVDLELFKKKPSPRFIFGLFIIVFSYIIAWPLISVLGVLAVYFKKPLLFAVGSPVAYGLSHLVFLLGVFVAGKETVTYMNVFLQWSLAKGLVRLLGQEVIDQSLTSEKQ